MAVQIFTGTLQVWMIYVYSLVFGIVGVYSPLLFYFVMAAHSGAV